MKPINRPITSREYKAMLNTERFRDRKAGAALFWELLTFLTENQGNEVIPPEEDPEKDEERVRTTWYLDTPGYELRRANIALHVREREGAKNPYKVTLKFRAPDRYTAAGNDISCSEEVDDDDIKFEEDIVRPFVSKFAYSVSFKTKEKPNLRSIKDVVELFPGVKEAGIESLTRVKTVNGFRAHEVVHYLGKLKLDKMPTARGLDRAMPDFVVKVAMSHWYLRAEQNDYPLVTEFSFGFDANAQEKENRLEMFPPTVVAGSNRLFRDVQNQAGWLAQFGSTKTAYVFDVM